MTGSFRLLHPAEVKDFFLHLGLMDELLEDRLHCRACEKVISLENFKVVERQSGRLLFLCDDPECLSWVEEAGEVQSSEEE